MKKIIITLALLTSIISASADIKKQLDDVSRQVEAIVKTIANIKKSIIETPVVTPLPVVVPDKVVIPSKFIVGVNFKGKSVTIKGNKWRGYDEALKSGLAVPKGINSYITKVKTLSKTDSDTYDMLNSVVWMSKTSWGFSHILDKGTYDIRIYVFENYKDHIRSFDLSIEGKRVATGIGKLKRGEYKEYLYKNISVTDGKLNIDFNTKYTDPHIVGFSVHTSEIKDFEYSFKNCGDNVYGHLTDDVANRIDINTLTMKHEYEGKVTSNKGSVVRLRGENATENMFRLPAYKGKPIKHKLSIEFTQVK